MSDLDKKLKEVLRECGGDWYHDGMVTDPTEDIDNCVEHIKQTFIGDGWKKHDKFGCIQFDLGEEQKAALMAKIIEKMMLRHEPVMTKEEWEAKAIKDGW